MAAFDPPITSTTLWVVNLAHVFDVTSIYLSGISSKYIDVPALITLEMCRIAHLEAR